jgi:hypothetical protein
MSRYKRPLDQHYESAKEKLAGMHAAAAFRKELITAHLLDSQRPIKDQPFPCSGEAKP